MDQLYIKLIDSVSYSGNSGWTHNCISSDTAVNQVFMACENFDVFHEEKFSEML